MEARRRAHPVRLLIADRDCFALRVFKTQLSLHVHRLMAYQLQRFVRKLFPALDAHFKEHDISYEMLCVQWFLPLLTSALPVHTAKRVFQLFLIQVNRECFLAIFYDFTKIVLVALAVQGWKVLFRVIMAVLRRFASALRVQQQKLHGHGHSKLNFQSFLRDWRQCCAYDSKYTVRPDVIPHGQRPCIANNTSMSAVFIHEVDRLRCFRNYCCR